MRKWMQGTLLLVAGLAMIGAGYFLPAARGQAVSPVMAASPADVAVDESSPGPVDYVRLHVVANSDAEADQALKRKVRDEILAVATPLLASSTSPQEAIELARTAVPQFEQVARQTIAESGFYYPVTVSLGKFSFPGKAYGDLFLPAGTYTAVRVAIGEAKGANWWCVLFPPLCFRDWIGGYVLEPRAGTGGKETVPVPRQTRQRSGSDTALEQAPVKVETHFYLLERFTGGPQ